MSSNFKKIINKKNIFIVTYGKIKKAEFSPLFYYIVFLFKSS